MPADPKPVRTKREPKPLERRTPLKTKRYDSRKGARSGVYLTCARPGCDRTFYVKPSKIGKSRYCSRSCAGIVDAERQRVTRRGVGNPNYKTGRNVGTKDITRVFNLRLKGERACRNCGSTDYVQLHHAIPRGQGTQESKTNLLNGVPLCGACHTGWHSGWLVITRVVFQRDEWEYLQSVEMTGRETAAWLDKHYPTEPRVPTCTKGHVLEGRNIAPNGSGARICRRCRMDRLAA